MVCLSLVLHRSCTENRVVRTIEIHSYFAGHKNKDVAFLHIASRTLVTADLFFNFPATEQYSKTGKSGRLPIVGDVAGKWLQPKVVGVFVADKTFVFCAPSPD